MTERSPKYVVPPEVQHKWPLPLWFRMFVINGVAFLLAGCLFDRKWPTYQDLFFAWLFGLLMTLALWFQEGNRYFQR